MSEYYTRVGAHYDEDAEAFDRRYWENPVLPRIRQQFREEVKRLPFETALEVGSGTGLDLVHFGTIYPERSFVGVDVSAEMVAHTRNRIERAGLENVEARQASVEIAPELRGPGAFDLCYVFFGALNTVEDLTTAASRLYEATAPGGHLVLTFVNRWYLAEIPLSILRGRPRDAFRRFRDVWGGYSPDRELPSRCLSPRHVDDAFGGGGTRVRRRGFSILYPPWYRARMVRVLGRAATLLWEADRWLSRTPAWSLGEYALYVYRKDS